MAAKFVELIIWHLDPCQNPTVVGSVVAIVKQADVPAVADRLQKIHQCTGPLRKLKPKNLFVLKTAGAAANHMSNMDLGKLIVANIQHNVTGLLFDGDTPAAQADNFVANTLHARQLKTDSPKQWQSMRKLAAAERFSWEVAAEQYEKELYESSGS